MERRSNNLVKERAHLAQADITLAQNYGYNPQQKKHLGEKVSWGCTLGLKIILVCKIEVTVLIQFTTNSHVIVSLTDYVKRSFLETFHY